MSNTFTLYLDTFLQPTLDGDTGWWYISTTGNQRYRVLSWDENKRVYRCSFWEPVLDENVGGWKYVSNLVRVVIPTKN